MTPYGFFAAAGAVTAIAWLRRHHRAMGLTENEFWAALWLIVIGAVIGAKALFVALGWPNFASGELRFWTDFGSGFVFFGGLLGAGLGGGAFAWWRKLNFWRGADFFGVALPLGHAIGRVGCYSQGCCAGRAPHTVQLYESAGLLVIAFLADRVLRAVNAGRVARGTAFCTYGLLYGGLRLGLGSTDDRNVCSVSRTSRASPSHCCSPVGWASCGCDVDARPQGPILTKSLRAAKRLSIYQHVASFTGSGILRQVFLKLSSGAGRRPISRPPLKPIGLGAEVAHEHRCRLKMKPDSERTCGLAARSR